MKFFLKYKALLLVLLVSFIAGAALLHEGLAPTHDGEYHVIRFYEFDKTFREGSLYPRWAPDLNNGFGVPLFNYVYPLPNYFASLIHSFGIGFIASVGINMFVATVIGAAFFYFWTKRYWGEAGGAISSIFYSFAPYRFVDMYVRGSVGEVWALAFFPALLWAYDNFVESKKTKFFIFASIFLGLLIYSHNILALMFFSFFLLYAVLLFFQKKETGSYIAHLCLLIVLGLGLSAPFWIPAIFEKDFVRGLEVFDVTQHFPQLYELIIPSWGSGFSGTQGFDKMSFQIGVANIIAVFFVIAHFFLKRKKHKPYNLQISFFLISFFIVIFLMLPPSVWLWKNIPLISYFQFPWRFLSLEIVIASFLAGSLFINYNFSKLRDKVGYALVIIVVIFLGINYAKPAFYHLRNDNHYISRSNFIDGTNSVGNAFNTKWLSKIPQKEKNKLVIASGRGVVSVVSQKSTAYSFKVIAKNDLQLIFNNAYFPGWKVFANGKEVEVKNVDGKIAFLLKSGDYSVDVRLVSTSIQLFSYACFFVSLVLLFFLRKISFFDITARKITSRA
jgi:uncharacterized membrane protein